MKRTLILLIMATFIPCILNAEIKAKKNINLTGNVVQQYSKYYNEQSYYLVTDKNEKYILIVDSEFSGPQFDSCIMKAFVKKKKISISGYALLIDRNTEWELSGDYTVCHILN